MTGTLLGGVTMSTDNQVECDRPGCEVLFAKKTHNQRYHNDECCRLATNAKIMEKYYERRDQKMGKPRTCKTCKKTKLSRYNDSQVCAACSSKWNESINNSVMEMLATAGIV